MTPEPLSAVDTAWLHMEDPTNLMMVTGILGFDEVLDFGRLGALMKERLLRVPRLRQRVVEGRIPFAAPRWETDPTFDLRAHLHHVALRPPGDREALRDLVSDLMSMPLDFSKPLWQFHVVEGYGRGSALVCRFHHALGDGVALVRLVLSIMDGGGEPPAPGHEEPHGWERIVSRTVAVTGSLVREGVETLIHPEHLLDLAARGASAADALAKLLLMPPDPPSPFKGPLGVAKRAAWSDPLPLGEVKETGKALGATVNDVLLAAVTGALRRYLEAREAPVAGLECRAVVPVNLRSPEEEDALGNRFGLVFLSLPVGIADPLERLLELKERMDEIKKSPEAVVAFGLLGAVGAVPAEVERVVVDLFGRGGTGVMTNVRGPTERVVLAGVPAREVMFWVPQSGRLGLGVSILSYAGGVSLGVATDAGLVPDPETILEGFRAEFDVLAASARRERSAAVSPRPAGRDGSSRSSGRKSRRPLPRGRKRPS
ncbi:MAG: wax ester/triacylglycerol synthase family O-acyltransferase [Thermoanaerobaculia bacterium]